MTVMSPLSALHAAIQAQDDKAAEIAVTSLLAADAPVLMTWLKAPDADQRWWAVRALAHCGGEEAAAALLAQMGEADPAVRSVAAFSLGTLHGRHPTTVRPLLPTLAAHLADADGRVRQVVADALALCGGDAIPALAVVLAGADQSARTRAAYALYKINDLQSAPLLFHYLNDPNYMVQTYMVETLDNLGLLDNVLLLP